MTIAFGVAALIFVLSVPRGIAQRDGDEWLRVITGEESVVDVDRSSLVLEQNRIIEAKFKITLSKSEPVAERSDIKYQTRLDSIQFNLKDGQYRILESTLLDASGKVILSSHSDSVDGWKPVEGRTGHLLFSAASQLPPLGTWKVRSYRYASGEAPENDAPPELTSLVGATFFLGLGDVHAFNKTCHSPIFEPIALTNDQFIKKVGSPLSSFGIQTPGVDALILTCETVLTYRIDDTDEPTLKRKVKEATLPIEYSITKRASPKDFPEQTLILRLGNGKALMLWDGVFLEIERPGNPFLP